MVPSSGDGHEPKEETSNDKKKEPKKFEVDGEQVLPEGERKKKKALQPKCVYATC